MAGAINETPRSYDANVQLIGRLADRFEIPRDEIAIPAYMPVSPPRLGLQMIGARTGHIELDGDTAGLQSVADAVRLASQLLSGIDSVEWAREAPGPAELGPAAVSFARGADGIGSLLSGWGIPEAWGTWSVGEEAVLELALPAAWSAELRIGLRYRIVPQPGSDPLVVECRLAGRMLGRWELDAASQSGELLLDPGPLGSGETVQLTLVNLNPRSPEEMGLSSDRRRLGIGLEAARSVPADPPGEALELAGLDAVLDQLQ
jgi:hypothetical protein